MRWSVASLALLCLVLTASCGNSDAFTGSSLTVGGTQEDDKKKRKKKAKSAETDLYGSSVETDTNKLDRASDNDDQPMTLPDIATDITAGYLTHPGGMAPVGATAAVQNGDVHTITVNDATVANDLRDQGKDHLAVTYLRLDADGMVIATGLLPQTKIEWQDLPDGQLRLAFRSNMRAYVQFGRLGAPLSQYLERGGKPDSEHSSLPGDPPAAPDQPAAVNTEERVTALIAGFTSRMIDYNRSTDVLNLADLANATPELDLRNSPHFAGLQPRQIGWVLHSIESALQPSHACYNPFQPGGQPCMAFAGDQFLAHNGMPGPDPGYLQIHWQSTYEMPNGGVQTLISYPISPVGDVEQTFVSLSLVQIQNRTYLAVAKGSRQSDQSSPLEIRRATETELYELEDTLDGTHVVTVDHSEPGSSPIYLDSKLDNPASPVLSPELADEAIGLSNQGCIGGLCGNNQTDSRFAGRFYQFVFKTIQAAEKADDLHKDYWQAVYP